MGLAWLRRGRRLALGLFCLTSGASVQAQWSTSLSADSDYRFRGVSLSESRPSLRAALNYDARNRCYGGASATRVGLARGDRYAQLLGYAGCVVATSAHPIELGATFSHFTGNSSYDYAEVYVGVLAERWNARLHFAPDYFGRHVSTVYAELDSHLLLNESLRLFGHFGAITRIGGPRGDDANRTRIDASVGAGLALREFDLRIAGVAASRGGPYPAVYERRRAAWLASVSCAF